MIALIAAITILSLSLVGTIHLLRYLTRQKIALPPVKFMLASGSALLLLVTVGILSRINLVNAQTGNITVEIIAGYNFVVDSNVTSPSTYAPSAATLMGKFCNTTSGTTYTNVQGFIGNYVDGSNDTPGVYPVRTVDATFTSQHPSLNNPGDYSLSHVGGRIGLRDATRYMGTLAPGECKVQYWQVTYPQCENLASGVSDSPPCTNDPVWGASNDPNDDLWLEYDVWVTTNDPTVNANTTRRATMRNEISANANKIFPNGGTWFNTDTSIIKPGGLITSNGVNYALGNVNKGFDNDGDGQYDYNAWLQPIGDASYDPSCFRLVRTSGTLTVTRSAMPDLIIPFTDQLYFTNLPTNNTSVDGNVAYTFLALDGPCNTSLTPYQEVASGADNEKFNGDYGASLPPVQSSEADVQIDKSGNITVTPGSTIDYSVSYDNTGTEDAGLPLVGMPLVISDTVPQGTSLTGTITAANARVLYSADNGSTWSETAPVPISSVTTVQWWLSDTVAAGATGAFSFSVAVDSVSPPPLIENCADASFGGATPFDQACTTTLVEGSNSIGDRVWNDANADGFLNGSESGINNILVSLYLDRNSDGVVDANDLLLFTQTTVTSGTVDGYYAFNNLPDGDFVVVVDSNDSDIPTGLSPSTATSFAISLSGGSNFSADFGFGPALGVTKTLLTSPVYEGRDVTYKIAVSNLRPGDGTGVASACTYDVWANNLVEAGTDWVNISNAIGAGGPDGAYSEGDFGGNGDVLEGDTFAFPSQNGNIVKVEAIYSLYLSNTLNVPPTNQIDDIEGRVYTSSTAVLITSTRFTNAFLNNNFSGNASNQGVLTWNITSARTGWTFADFADLSVELFILKNGGADGAIVNLDALGFRITTDAQCGGSDDTIDPAPLRDEYDADRLQFVSATPGANSATTGGSSPYANTGTIAWNDIGPLYAGQTKEFTVTFTGLEPPGNGTTTITNSGIVTNAFFLTSGAAANSAQSDVSHQITGTGSISGVVWIEGNDPANGWIATVGYESGTDFFAPNITVTLYLCTGLSSPNTGQACTSGANGGTWTAVATQTTNVFGEYVFSGLLDAYYIVAADSNGLPGSPGLQSADPTPNATGVTCPNAACDDQWGAFTDNLNALEPINGGQDITDVNFGYPNDASIYGNIFYDYNGDGIQDPLDNGLDNGLAGITVTLTGVDSGGNPVSKSTQTLANGRYTFGEVNAGGPYTITVDTTTFPAGTWTQTGDPDSVLDDRHGIGTLVLGQVSGPHDFGYTQSGTGSIGDSLFTDWNSNGTADTGEGISGITITLYRDLDGNNTLDLSVDALVVTQTTSITGFYLFSGLPDATYFVVVDESALPSGYVQTVDRDTTLDGQTTVTTTGAAVLDADFGYRPSGTGSIGDLVWRDVDGNGIQSGGSETGIANITVTLYVDDGDGVFSTTTDAVVTTTVSGSNGDYLFDDLAAATYWIDVATDDPDLPTDSFGNVFTLTTNNDPLSVTLSAGQSFQDADFGFAAPGNIGDLIWRDDNRDGDPAGEFGISGIEVSLYRDVDNDGLFTNGVDTLVATTTTNATGNYTFTNLSPFTYVVIFTDTRPLTFDPDGTDNYETAVNISYGQTFFGADFGLENSNGAIGDALWIDLDDDDVYDTGTESGIAGVVITVTDITGTVVDTDTTDSDGLYLFANLPDGVYTVTVNAADLPAGIRQKFEQDGTLDLQTVVTVTGGANRLDIDFGFEPLLNVTKTSVGENDPLNPGDTITYTIVISNPSPALATAFGVRITDTIPTGTNFVTDSMTIDPASAADPVTQTTGTPPQLDINPITVPGQGLVTITFRVTVATSISGNRIDNTAYLSSTAGITDTDTATNSVLGTPIPGVVIDPDNSSTTVPGTTVTYTHIVTNAGDSTDVFTLTASSDQGYTVQTSVPTVSLGSNFTTTVIVSITIPAGTISGTVDTTTITATSSLSPTLSDTATDTTTVGSVPGVVIDPDNSSTTVPGTTVTYTHVVTNLGNATDTFTITTGSSQGYTVTTSIPSVTLAPNATATVVVSITIPAGASSGTVDTTTITATSGLSPTLSDTATDTTTVGSVPGVVIDPDNSGATLPGTTITYTHVVTNLGNATDTFTITAGSNQGYTVTTNIPSVTLAPNATATVVVSITIPTSAISGTVDTTTITATSGLSPTVSDTATDTTTVATQFVDGVVYLDVDGDGVYTPGTDDSQSNVDVVITDTNGITYVVTTNASGVFSQTVPPGDTIVDVDETDLPANVSLTNNGSGQGSDPTTVGVPAGGSATDNTGYVTPPVIGLAKRVDGNTDNGNNTHTVTYTLVVENLGSIILNNVQITDDLSTTFAGADAFAVTAGPSSDLLTPNPGFTGVAPNLTMLAGTDSLSVGQSAIVSFTVVVTPGTNLGPYTNTATAGGSHPVGGSVSDDSNNGSNPDPDDNDTPDENSPTPVSFVPGADLELTKSVAPATVQVGDRLTYTVVVLNRGPLTATGVTVEDLLPAGLSLAASSATEGSYSAPIWTIGTVDPGQSVTLTLVATVNTSSLITNTALISTATENDPDSTPGNNEPAEDDQDSVPITPQVTPGLIIDPDNSSTTVPGTTVTYTHVVTNLGNATDTFTLTTGSSQGYTVTTSIPSVTLAPNATATVVVSITIPASAPSGTVDTTTITATSGLSPTLSDTATDTTTVGSIPGVVIDPDNSGATLPGTTITYTHVVTNLGNATDTFTITAGSNQGYTVTTNIPSVTLAPNATATVVVSITIPTSAISGTVDTTTITATSGLSPTVSDTATDTTTVATQFVDGVVYLDVDGDGVYTPGTDDPQSNVDVVITDTNGITYVVTTNASGVFSQTVPPGDTIVDVDETDLPANVSLTNNGSGQGSDPTTVGVPAGGSATDNTGYVTPPVIGLAKRVDGNTDNGNNTHTVTYTLVVENLGSIILNNVQITDDLSTTFAGADAFAVTAGPSSDLLTPNPGFTGVAPNLTMLAGTDSLSVGQSAIVSFTVVVTPGTNLGPYTNTATAGGSHPVGGSVSDDSNNGSNPDPDDNNTPDENSPTPVSFVPGADLELTKSVAPATVQVGDRLTYTVVVLNRGPLTATGVTVEDSLPTGLSLAASSATEGSYSAPIWTIGTVDPGQSVTLTLVATVNTSSLITNTALISTATENDPDSTPGNNEPAEDDQDSASITPQVTPGLVIDPDNSSTTVPGTTVTYTHVVTNLGNATDTFTITTGSSQGYTVTTSIPSVTLAPNATATVVVSITIPASAPSGTVDTTTITATSGLSPTLSDTATDTTTVGTQFVDGVLYLDVDGDGVFSNTVDTPLTGVPVVITDTNGITYVVTTNASGVFSQTVPSGSTIVDVDDTGLPPNVTLTTGSTDPTTVIVPAGGSATDNTGYVYTQFVDGVLYLDVDGDGVFSSTVDTPLPNVDVVITDTNGITYVVTTNASGVFSQTVPPGSTIVDVDDTGLPPNVTLTTGSTDPTTVIVPAGGSATDNTGYVYTQFVDGVLYLDVDGDGVFSSTVDTPLTGVPVVITDTNGITYVVTTNASGVFSQTVPPGSTIVDVDDTGLPPNVTLTTGSTDPTTVIVPAGGSATDNTGYVTPVVSNPGVAVAKSVDISNVAPNQMVTYTLTVSNTGDVTLNPVAVTDTLPTMFTLGGATPAPDSTTNNMLVWNDVTAGAGLAPNAQVQLVITAVAPLTVGTYINVVVVEATHPGGVVTDTDSVPVFVTDPVVNLVKNVVPPGAVDGVITFTILITNTGPSTLDVVPLIDVYTGPIQYIGGNPVADDSSTLGTLVWNDLTVSFGQDLAPSQTFTITTVFSLTTQSTEFSMMNVATVTNAIDVFNNPVIDVSDPEEIINQPTAISLLYFEANRQGDLVILNWATAVEIDNFGFRILRSATGLLADATEITFIPSHGSGTMSGASYSYIDQTAAPNERYTYWLVDVDVNGVETQHGPAIVEALSIDAGEETTIYMPVIVKE